MLASLHVLQPLGVYIYLTYPNAGTLLSHLNIAMICVCMYVCVVCVCCVSVCVCACVSVIVFVQMCMRRLIFKLYFLCICEHSNLYLPSFP